MTMSKRTKAAAAAATVLALGGGGAAVAVATGGGDDSEQPITGAALERAEAAALEHTGGGSVTETETGDEESFYEVEVSGEDGSQTDVQLNRDFTVVGSEADEEESGGADDD